MYAALVSWLREQNGQIRQLEQKAATLLYTKKDQAAYKEQMEAKALLLARLATSALPYLQDLPEEQKFQVLDQLQEFSAGADNALALDSVFYMSALLYPEDHQPGEPTTLDLYIASLENNESGKAD